MIENPTLTREQIIAEARSWLGTPIHHQGRLKGVGVDCIGFVSGVFQNLNCKISDLADYPRIPKGFPKGNLLIEKLSEHLLEIDKDQAEPGDILVFSDVKGEPCHVAFRTDYGWYVACFLCGPKGCRTWHKL